MEEIIESAGGQIFDHTRLVLILNKKSQIILTHYSLFIKIYLYTNLISDETVDEILKEQMRQFRTRDQVTQFHNCNNFTNMLPPELVNKIKQN